jgi:uncharacterized protein (TIGR00369 family)
MNLPSKTLTPMAHTADNRCFGCGPANAAGLHLEFLLAGDGSVVCRTTVPDRFEGHPGYLHGGVIATLLDEIMSKSVRARGLLAMTRRMEIDYLRPVPSCVPIRMEGTVVGSEGRKHWSQARILDTKGRILAEGKGLFIEVRSRAFEESAPCGPRGEPVRVGDGEEQGGT